MCDREEDKFSLFDLACSTDDKIERSVITSMINILGDKMGILTVKDLKSADIKDIACCAGLGAKKLELICKMKNIEPDKELARKNSAKNRTESLVRFMKSKFENEKADLLEQLLLYDSKSARGLYNCLCRNGIDNIEKLRIANLDSDEYKGIGKERRTQVEGFLQTIALNN